MGPSAAARSGVAIGGERRGGRSFRCRPVRRRRLAVGLDQVRCSPRPACGGRWPLRLTAMTRHAQSGPQNGTEAVTIDLKLWTIDAVTLTLGSQASDHRARSSGSSDDGAAWRPVAGQQAFCRLAAALNRPGDMQRYQLYRRRGRGSKCRRLHDPMSFWTIVELAVTDSRAMLKTANADGTRRLFHGRLSAISAAAASIARWLRCRKTHVTRKTSQNATRLVIARRSGAPRLSRCCSAPCRRHAASGGFASCRFRAHCPDLPRTARPVGSFRGGGAPSLTPPRRSTGTAEWCPVNARSRFAQRWRRSWERGPRCSPATSP